MSHDRIMFYSNDTKKVVARVAVLGVLLMIVVGCNSATDDAKTGAVSDIKIGMTEQQVRDTLGEPAATSLSGKTGQSGLVYMDLEDADFLQIWFTEGKVSEIKPSQRSSDTPWLD